MAEVEVGAKKKTVCASIRESIVFPNTKHCLRELRWRVRRRPGREKSGWWCLFLFWWW